jgi:hypothetical protein
MWADNRRGFDGQLDEVRLFTFETDQFNPATDLQLTEVFTERPMSLDINRDTGAVTLSNPSSNTTAYQVAGYAILSSDVGAIDDSQWLSIAENYDANWLEFVSSNGEVAEGTLGTTAIVPGTSLDLGNIWIQNPNEDFSVELLLGDGTVSTTAIAVSYDGNDGAAFDVGDVNFDGSVTAADWPVFRDVWTTDVSAMSVAEAYQNGDLNGDGVSNIEDFDTFRLAYEAANGGGSFAAMLSSVPEPSAIVLVVLGGFALVLRRQRFSEWNGSITQAAAMLLGLLFALSAAPLANATTTAATSTI